jgi:polysaccharide export outer membrane protein
MNNKRKNYLISIASILVAIALSASPAMPQQLSPAQVEQAKSQLQTMSPAEIDAKIKELGMTRDEAEAKAKAYGIDLQSYLQGAPVAPQTTAPQTTAPQTAAPQTTVIVQTPGNDTTAAAQPANVNAAAQNPAPRLPSLTPADSLIFGIRFFRTSPSAFTPSPSIDDKQYILGAGDVLMISLWGQVQSTQEVTVDSDGRITLSSVGPILVAGYTIHDAKQKIVIALSRSYAGLVSNPPTIFMDLSLSKLRPVRVFIMGEVNNPGGYFVNSFANVFNSLFVVGGPKPSGSFRDVRVIRNGKVIAHVDLYDYLLGSPKTNDLRINDNDIIFVPLKGKSVQITGEVVRPYIYELLPGENLKKLLEFSGGIRSTMYRDLAQVSRIIPFAERVKGEYDRKIFDINFKDIVEGKKDYTLEDGDAVTIFPFINREDNYVAVEGDVKHPGRYQFDKIATVKDLIAAADGLWPTAFLTRAGLIRIYPDEHREKIAIDLGKAMAGDASNNVTLQKRDSLYVYNMYEVNPRTTITVMGHAKRPGTYLFADSMTVKKILLSFGGMEDSVFRANTFLDRADIFRLNDDLVTRRKLSFNIAKILDGSAHDIPIVQGDSIRLYGLNEITFIDKTVQIFGNVKNPGTYNLVNGMTLTDLLLQAGGYTQDAWTQQAEIARVTRNAQQQDSLVHILFSDLPDLFDTTRTALSILSSNAGSFKLIDKDQVFIRPNPDYKLQKLVTMKGEVRFPGTYALSTMKERLSDLIKRAGGLRKDGYARGGSLVRDSVRLRLNIQEALDDPGGKYDAVLFPGDTITIPKDPNSVYVLGEVNNPGRYSYVGGESKSFYLDFAGGVTDSADYVLINYPEGYIVKTGIGTIFSKNPDIPDGTTIYVTKVKVPPPPPPTQQGQTTFDFVKDLMAIVVSSVTIIVLASKL